MSLYKHLCMTMNSMHIQRLSSCFVWLYYAIVYNHGMIKYDGICALVVDHISFINMLIHLLLCYKNADRLYLLFTYCFS